MELADPLVIASEHLQLSKLLPLHFQALSLRYGLRMLEYFLELVSRHGCAHLVELKLLVLAHVQDRVLEEEADEAARSVEKGPSTLPGIGLGCMLDEKLGGVVMVDQPCDVTWVDGGREKILVVAETHCID